MGGGNQVNCYSPELPKQTHYLAVQFCGTKIQTLPLKYSEAGVLVKSFDNGETLKRLFPSEKFESGL